MTSVQQVRSSVPASTARAEASVKPAVRDAFLILYAGFTLLPILAGFDKFFHFLVDWEIYLAPVATQVLPVDAQAFMMLVGVVEILAGILVLLRPQIGAYVVAVWLWAIIANLLLVPGYFDIAVRDFGLSLGALALARLASEFSAAATVPSPKQPA